MRRASRSDERIPISSGAVSMRFAIFAAGLVAACHRPAPPPPPPVDSLIVAARSDAGPRTCAAIVGAVTERPLHRPIAEVMSYRGADWLDRADRDASDEPDRVVGALGLHDGDLVGDIGAGSGYFTMRLAKKVAPLGSVTAVDVQPEMLALLRKKVEAAHVTNVTLVNSTDTDLRLGERSLDLALMVDVYHELHAPSAALAQLRCALRPGGRLAFVEYRAEDPKVEIKPEHKMLLATLRDEVEAAGFALDHVDEFLPRQHLAIFKKRDFVAPSAGD